MRYGQFCPIAKAAEILAERWMPLVAHELLAGSTRFADIHRGVPADVAEPPLPSAEGTCGSRAGRAADIWKAPRVASHRGRTGSRSSNSCHGRVGAQVRPGSARRKRPRCTSPHVEHETPGEPGELPARARNRGF